jgi:hypothetical protein
VVIYPRALRAGVETLQSSNISKRKLQTGDAGMPARILVVDDDPLSNC